MRGRELVGKNIKRVRVAKGVSQEQLAFDAAIDRSYLGGIERCDENPSVDTLDKIAGVLGIELAELFQPVALDAPIAGLRPGRKKRV
jgi:transcriptional regulator with XRE-family HTH domain